MADLTNSQRIKCGRAFALRAYQELNSTANLTKDDIKAAVDATDDWIDDNQASFNTALPNPFKTTATLDQKTILFVIVALERAGLLTQGD